MIETFEKIDFEYQEFLISPTQIGIPNSRLRYYAIGIKRGSHWKFDFETKPNGQIWSDDFDQIFKSDKPLSSLESYLDHNPDSELLLPDKTLIKHAQIFDIVNKNSNRSCCFTKAYGRYAEGTGTSLLYVLELLTLIYKLYFMHCYGSNLRSYQCLEKAR